MALSPRIRRELPKLRELVHHLLVGQACWFCHVPFLSDPAPVGRRGGDGTGPALAAKISIHHLDGNHDNDADENKVLAHRRCHKSHHMQLRHAARRAEAA